MRVVTGREGPASGTLNSYRPELTSVPFGKVVPTTDFKKVS